MSWARVGMVLQTGSAGSGGPAGGASEFKLQPPVNYLSGLGAQAVQGGSGTLTARDS